MTMFGQLFRVKGFNALLGGVSLMFLKEYVPLSCTSRILTIYLEFLCSQGSSQSIELRPLLKYIFRYQVETMLVAWNDRWFFERACEPLSLGATLRLQ